MSLAISWYGVALGASVIVFALVLFIVVWLFLFWLVSDD